MSEKESEVNLDLFDAEVQAFPWAAYKVMRDQGPVYRDPKSGYFLVTRYKELRETTLDDESFLVRDPDATEPGMMWKGAYPWGEKIENAFKERGWLGGASLQAMNGRLHREVRSVFDHALRPRKIREMDTVAFDVATKLIDGFVARGKCNWLEQFAVPLPLYVIGIQAGVDDEHLPRILEWTDAFIALFGRMCDEQESMRCVDKLIEAQHFFQPMIEQYRKEPGEGLVSDLVNLEVPFLGRKLNDNELHTHIMPELFVGGAETTRNALASGMEIMIRRPDVWEKLKGDPDKYMRQFVEEVLRSNSPAQGLYKIAQKDTEIAGVRIPKGSTVIPRYGCANHDERHFENPEEFDLERKNAGTHVAFGAGPHHCLGASLARRELYWGFKTAVERFDSVRFAEGKNDFAYHPNFALRGLKELHIEFTPARG